MKILLKRIEVHRLLPGQGRGMFDTLTAAQWLTALPNGFYKSGDVQECLARLERGETPRPVHVWKSTIDRTKHVVDSKGRAACGSREKNWLILNDTDRVCTRCVHAAKSLHVVEV